MINIELITTAEAGVILDQTPRQIARMVENDTLEAALKLPGVRGAYLFDPDYIASLASE